MSSDLRIWKRACLTALAILLTAPMAISGEEALRLRAAALTQQIEFRFAAEPERANVLLTAIEDLQRAWDVVDRPSEGDHDRFHRWLDQAFRATMPGQSARFAEPPVFVGSPRLTQPIGVIEPIAEAAPAELLPPPIVREIADQLSTTDQSNQDASEDRTSEPTVEAGPAFGSVLVKPGFAAREPTSREAAKPILGAVPNETALEELVESPARRFKEPRKPTRSRWSRHPAAAPLDWQDPFASDPAASVNPLRSGSSRRVRRPEFRTDNEVAVDLSELNARVRGFNSAMRSLQQRLLADPAPDAFSLSDWADELEQLAEEQGFLDLYRDGLPAEAVRLVPPSPSIEVVSELLRRRAQDQLQSNRGRGAVEQRALETISARMSRLDASRRGY